MRRAIVTLCLVLASLAAFSSRADAFFWSWLDDLSGPKFRGIAVDWQLWCRNKDIPVTGSMIRMSKMQLDEDSVRLFQPAISHAPRGGPAHRSFEAAEVAAQAARRALSEAETLVLIGDTAGTLRSYRAAVDAWSDAADLFKEGLKEPDSAPVRANETFQKEMSAREKQAPFKKRGFPSAGVLVSLCDHEPHQQMTRFVAFHYGFGWDFKKENAAEQNRMVTLGLSLHSIVKPYLTVGTGAGVVAFTGEDVDGFYKAYVQPFIIDVRPIALFRSGERKNDPSSQLLLIRFDGMVFPSGFKAGQFGGTSKRFKAEFVPNIGVQFDLTRYIWKWQDRSEKTTKNGGH